MRCPKCKEYSYRTYSCPRCGTRMQSVRTRQPDGLVRTPKTASSVPEAPCPICVRPVRQTKDSMLTHLSRYHPGLSIRERSDAYHAWVDGTEFVPFEPEMARTASMDAATAQYVKLRHKVDEEEVSRRPAPDPEQEFWESCIRQSHGEVAVMQYRRSVRQAKGAH